MPRSSGFKAYCVPHIQSKQRPRQRGGRCVWGCLCVCVCVCLCVFVCTLQADSILFSACWAPQSSSTFWSCPGSANSDIFIRHACTHTHTHTHTQIHYTHKHKMHICMLRQIHNHTNMHTCKLMHTRICLCFADTHTQIKHLHIFSCVGSRLWGWLCRLYTLSVLISVFLCVFTCSGVCALPEMREDGMRS